MLQPILFRLAEICESRLPPTLMSSQEIVTSADGQAHQPMLKWRFTPIPFKFLICLAPYLLDNIFDLTLPPGIAACGRKHPGRIFLDQRFEAFSVTLQDGGNQLRIRSFHRRKYARARA